MANIYKQINNFNTYKLLYYGSESDGLKTFHSADTTETINDKFIVIYLIHSNTNRKKGTEVITQTRGQHGEILSLI